MILMKPSECSKKKVIVQYNVKVSQEAFYDLQKYTNYISQKSYNPKTARRIRAEIYREIRKLNFFPFRFPDSGFKRRGYAVRKKAYKSFLILYIIDEKEHEVNVIRIIRDMMNWESMLESSDK